MRPKSGVHLPTAERHRRVSVSRGKLMKPLGKRAFPHLRYNLTAYIFRHALAANMKVSGQFYPEAIARAPGHQSTRTQVHYGLMSSTLVTARLVPPA
jgi:integrase